MRVKKLFISIILGTMLIGGTVAEASEKNNGSSSYVSSTKLANKSTGKGTWKKDKKGWYFICSDKSYMKNDLVFINKNGDFTKYRSEVKKLNTNIGTLYFFNENGYMAKSRFVSEYGDSYWSVGHSSSTSTGKGSSIGIAIAPGKSSYSYGSSVAISSTSKDVKYFWINKSGVVGYKAAYTWHKDKKGYWFGNKKWYAKSEWLKLGEHWYYFNAKGYMVTGKQKIGGKTYTFNKDGILVK